MAIEQIVLDAINKINQVNPSAPISFDMLKEPLSNIPEGDISDALDKLEQKEEIKVLTRNIYHGANAINMFQKI